MSTANPPRFLPTLSSDPPDPPFFPASSDTSSWIPVLRCPADFPLELFETAALQLVAHPEYNSTLILRSETLADVTPPDGIPLAAPHIQGLAAIRSIHRRLLPRRPGRDAPVEQHCTLYAPAVAEAGSRPTAHDASASVLVLTPVVPPAGALPYYHPAVNHIALRYIPALPSSSSPDPADVSSWGALELLAVPHVPVDARDPSSRLHRTCRALLESLHRYGWGARLSYRKRAQHDRLVPREPYQDLYLLMRERHKGLVETWVEATDPLKHVFEDIGIATYLMLLWKDTFPASTCTTDAHADDPAEPWRAWPRPPGGFVDIGCGNGLLVHILVSEGYAGFGFDVRARKSWTGFPPATRAALRVHALDPTLASSSSPVPTADNADGDACAWPPGAFVIANHADELTPWAPVLARMRGAAGYLSLPCCAWAFDGRFARNAQTGAAGAPFAFLFAPRGDGVEDGGHQDEAAFVESLGLGSDATAASSAYAAYRVWLARLAVACGWEVEADTLRIPSTRNWALVGRKPAGNEGLDDVCERMEQLLDTVRERAQFKPRRPEGKTGDH